MRWLMLVFALFPGLLPAQDKSVPNPNPDTLIFSNGEQLSGALERADNTGITFHSPMAGELKVKWANIRELRTSKAFAVLAEHTNLTPRDADALVPVGAVHVLSHTISVASAQGEKTVPTADARQVIDAAAFDHAVHHQPGLTEGWGGSATAGVSLIRATQNATTFNGNVALERTTPAVDWLPPRTRSLVNYSQSYGTSSTPAVDAATGLGVNSTIKSNIFHANAEFDRYFSPRLFAFGNTTFDHNFAQSLDLQQSYGGGLGITFRHTAVEELDAKGDVHYEKQAFFNSAQNLNLFGSTFSERYLRHLVRGIVLNQSASISPAWNNTNAYSAHADANVTFPVYRSLGFSLGAIDDYLNNAPAGSKKNSVEFTSGLTYTIKPR